MENSQYLWVVVVLMAAAAQTVRNASQRSLTGDLGTWPSTLVRFLFGLPFVALAMALFYALPSETPALPNFSLPYFSWIAFGATFQVLATAALLLAMQSGNFAVAVTFSKTEVLQLMLFSSLILAEFPTGWQLIAALVASFGVFMLSMPKDPAQRHWRTWMSRSAIYGLICGACFALAVLGFRAAALHIQIPQPWISAVWGVFIAQFLQSVVLGGWLMWKDRPGLAATVRSWRLSLLAGSMGALASLLWFSAYSMQTAGAVRTVGMAEVIFSYFVSRKIMHERLRTTEKIGLLLVVASTLLISLSV